MTTDDKRNIALGCALAAVIFVIPPATIPVLLLGSGVTVLVLGLSGAFKGGSADA